MAQPHGQEEKGICMCIRVYGMWSGYDVGAYIYPLGFLHLQIYHNDTPCYYWPNCIHNAIAQQKYV